MPTKLPTGWRVVHTYGDIRPQGIPVDKTVIPPHLVKPIARTIEEAVAIAEVPAAAGFLLNAWGPAGGPGGNAGTSLPMHPRRDTGHLKYTQPHVLRRLRKSHYGSFGK
jgi:hypothetical protein